MSSPDAPIGVDAPRPRLGRGTLFLLLLTIVLFVLVPFLFWRATWFGRALTEQEMEQYFADREHSRKAQHALVQVAERIVRGDPTAKQWYPQVRTLAGHESPEIRSTAAWVMGQDNQSAEFHAALLELLRDPEPLVRRNAALSLVRFGDAGGRLELRAMLRPYTVGAPRAGVLDIRLVEGNPVNPGTLLARIQASPEETIELRSPMSGTVARWLRAEGAPVAEGDELVSLTPSEEQVWEALRALYLVGQPDDLPDIEPYAGGRAGMVNRIQQQARLTADAIRRRSE